MKDHMGRPRKADDERRTERLPAPRVTVAELAFVEAQAATAGLDPSEFIRRRVLGRKVAPARTVADERLLVEINRVGVNLNQIAKAAHLGKTLEGKLAAALEDVQTAMAKVAAGGP